MAEKGQGSRSVFGTLVTCIDGRAQRPPTDWLRERFQLDYVDIISEPGPDKLLAEGWPSDLVPVRKKIDISVTAHASRAIALCGHHECAANPNTIEGHKEQIRKGVALLRSWSLGVPIAGLWLNENWTIEVIVPPAP